MSETALDKNPLIQANTIDTLSNVRCVLSFIASLYATSDNEWCDSPETTLGAYLSLRCAEQAMFYEINRLKDADSKKSPTGGKALA